MNYADTNTNTYQPWGQIAAHAEVDERVDFIRRTYVHLLAAILAFAGLEAVLLQTPLGGQMINTIFGAGRFGGILFVGAFCLVSWVANSWAQNSTSKGMQYAGLSLYVVAEAFFFLPVLYYADSKVFEGQHIIESAGTVTILIFAGLTAIVFLTKKDFSFLGGILMLGGLAAFGLAICSMIFGFHLGIAYTIGMITLACGYILYDTSNVLHKYRIGQHVAAALALFASVALLFYYVLRLFMDRSSSR